MGKIWNWATKPEYPGEPFFCMRVTKEITIPRREFRDCGWIKDREPENIGEIEDAIAYLESKKGRLIDYKK